MNWQLFISLRYFAAKRKEKFISLVSLISVLGIAVGVAALIIVISVMSGFDEDLKEKIVGTYSHLEVTSDAGMRPSEDALRKVLNAPHVMAASFFLHGQALARSGDDVMGVIVKGIVPKTEVQVKKIGQYMREGSLELKDDGIVVGSELAHKMNLKIGSVVSLVSPADAKSKNALGIVSNIYAGGTDFRVSGIFTSGMYEYDMNLVYVDMAKAQELFGVRDTASGIAVKADDLFNVEIVKKELQRLFGFQYMVRTWVDSNRNFLEAIKLEKTVMFIILTLIVMVACFNIASGLIMTVLEKTKDIGILKAIGASNFNVMMVFAMQGALIGIIGTCLGALSGIAACWCLKTYKFINLPKDIYYIDKLPVKLDITDISTIVALSIIISIAAAIYPAYRASKLDPVEALRYE